ncbi:MAG: hypothetical protein IKQ31_04910 [Clostridia bacterium]|nr:hypothetical protein [Clostridia bacterium]
MAARSSSKTKTKLCSCAGGSSKNCPSCKREKSVECGSESSIKRSRGAKKAK